MPEKSESENRSRERYFAALAWAEKHLPDEHAPFAASASMTIQALQHRQPSAQEVRQRLIDQKRDRESLR